MFVVVVVSDRIVPSGFVTRVVVDVEPSGLTRDVSEVVDPSGFVTVVVPVPSGTGG
jgi:hypothetical protein